MEIKNYHQATTLLDAYETLNKDPKNVIIGGGLWLKHANQNVNTLIDLSQLGLNQITEEKDDIVVGAMVTIRDFETNPLIHQLASGMLYLGTNQIMGTGFRNMATIGGSVFGKYPFSDLITPLLALDTRLVFFMSGEMSLLEYIERKGKLSDILVYIKIKKHAGKGYFKKVANTQLAFSMLNVAIHYQHQQFKIVVGSRPGIAELAIEAMNHLNQAKSITKDVIHEAVELMAKTTQFGNNEDATEGYRRELAKVYMKRGIEEVLA
jgi:CO/xanthine dehydrogenase FAD-binding subunit